MKVGLALSGGGSRGFAHLGAIKALNEKGIVPHAIAGTSAGSLVGALIAEGYSPDYIADAILNLGVRKHLKFALNRFGLFSMVNVEKILKEFIPHNSFEGLKIPLTVCTTDIHKSEAVYFSSGQLIKPLLASCSLPGIFEPITFEGMQLVDGGLMNNLPTEPLISTCDFIIGINVTPMVGNLPIKSAKDILMKSLYIAISRQSAEKLDSCDIAIEPLNLINYDALSIVKAREMFDLGYIAAQEQLASKLPTVH